MNLNFAVILATLGPDAAFRIANGARTLAAFLFAALLPEQNMPSYSIDSGNMTVRATMAGLVSMDSPYPPGGLIDASTFLEQSAKLGLEATLPETALRRLQELIMRIGATGGNTNEALANEVLNFTQKVIVQPQLDVAEWLRGQALVKGEINWTFNKKNLLVNYGVPAGNFLANRTGNDHYGGSTSKFWSDIQALRKVLRGDVRAFIVHPDTMDLIRYNPANGMAVVGEANGQITFRRFARQGDGSVWPGVFSQDATENVTLVSYAREGEILNPANPDGPSIRLPFMQVGKILAVGNNNDDGYQVGRGSQDEDPNRQAALGYTHIAPTVEGGGRPGRWARVFTPEGRPWQLTGQSVSNILPVITAPDKIAVASTAMS